MTTADKNAWERLLSNKRLAADGEDTIDRDSFEIDQDIIVFSQPFRRLKDKTQVYPLSENDHVRTRLSHSLEVASVGQALGSLVASRIIERYGLDGSKYRRETFGCIVKAASLVHDIGHPPLGHMGEQAIMEWFQSGRGKTLIEHFSTPVQKELQCFEGNAQGFRIVARIENNKDGGGLQLTCATLGALMKYPWGIDHEHAQRFGNEKRKFGFFQPERDYAKEVAETVGLEAVGKYGWVRHPLAYLAEAADDISYMMADLEDGIEVGDYRVNDFYRLIKSFLKEAVETPEGWERKYNELAHPNQKISFLRSRAIYVLAHQVANVFIDYESQMVQGKYYDHGKGKAFYRPLLDEIDNENTRAFLKNVRAIPPEYLYYGSRKLYIEIAYHKVVHGLLDAFTEAVLDNSKSLRSKHLFRLMGRDRPIDGDDIERKIRSVVDFVSGMTDRFALGMYRQLEGISLGGMPPTEAPN